MDDLEKFEFQKLICSFETRIYVTVWVQIQICQQLRSDKIFKQPSASAFGTTVKRKSNKPQSKTKQKTPPKKFIMHFYLTAYLQSPANTTKFSDFF